MMDNIEIDYEKKLAKTEVIVNEILTIMQSDSNYTEAKNKLEKNVIEKRDQTKLRVAFVGQYSAGKSTIISALTGINDIKIDSDVATDNTKDYEWGGVVITDTPGIGTDNIDHDEKTYEMLKRADIIVYCLTYSLFNPESLDNFTKIAYEKKYANKIILLVNKMDSEQGVFPDLVNNYTQTLRKQLTPHDLERFPITFVISAFELDPELKEYSNFDDFRSKLNQLIANQDKFAELESLTHTIIDTVEDSIIVADNMAADEEIKLGKMTENKYIRAKRDVNTQIFSKLSQLKNDIHAIGIKLSNKVGDEDFDRLVESSGSQIEKWYEEITSTINNEYQNAALQLEVDLQQIGNSETFKNLSKVNVYRSNGSSTGNYSTFSMINNNIGKGAKTVSHMSQGAKYSSGLLKSSTASGSNTHHLVKFVGKQIGFKFKPWQAVNIAKNLGNVAKVAGPLVGIAAMYIDHKDAQREEENDRKLRNVQNEVKTSFIDIGNDMYRELSVSTDAVNTEIFDNTIDEIRAERQRIISENKNLDSTAKKLMTKVAELNELIA
jgi:small GTP-binding protein